MTKDNFIMLKKHGEIEIVLHVDEAVAWIAGKKKLRLRFIGDNVVIKAYGKDAIIYDGDVCNALFWLTARYNYKTMTVPDPKAVVL